MPFQKLNGYTKKISNLADTPSATMSASEIKAWFDSSPEEIRVAFNTLVDLLNSTNGASNIGVSAITGVTGSNIQAMLSSLKTLIDNTATGTIPNGTITYNKFATDVTQKFTATDTAIATANANIGTNTTNISSANTRITTNATNIAKHTDDIALANQKIQTNINDISALKTRATTIEGVNSTQNTNITSLTNRVTAVEGVNSTQAASINNLMLKGISDMGANSNGYFIKYEDGTILMYGLRYHNSIVTSAGGGISDLLPHSIGSVIYMGHSITEMNDPNIRILRTTYTASVGHLQIITNFNSGTLTNFGYSFLVIGRWK